MTCSLGIDDSTGGGNVWTSSGTDGIVTSPAAMSCSSRVIATGTSITAGPVVGDQERLAGRHAWDISPLRFRISRWPLVSMPLP